MKDEPYGRITRVRGREEDGDVVWDAYDYDDKFLLTMPHSGLEQIIEHPDRATLIDLVEADGSTVRLTAKYLYLRFGGGPPVQ